MSWVRHQAILSAVVAGGWPSGRFLAGRRFHRCAATSNSSTGAGSATDSSWMAAGRGAGGAASAAFLARAAAKILAVLGFLPGSLGRSALRPVWLPRRSSGWRATRLCACGGQDVGRARFSVPAAAGAAAAGAAPPAALARAAAKISAVDDFAPGTLAGAAFAAAGLASVLAAGLAAFSFRPRAWAPAWAQPARSRDRCRTNRCSARRRTRPCPTVHVHGLDDAGKSFEPRQLGPRVVDDDVFVGVVLFQFFDRLVHRLIHPEIAAKHSTTPSGFVSIQRVFWSKPAVESRSKPGVAGSRYAG